MSIVIYFDHTHTHGPKFRTGTAPTPRTLVIVLNRIRARTRTFLGTFNSIHTRTRTFTHYVQQN